MPKPLNVAEACSGIRMLMLFFALCVGASFLLTKKALWERIVIVISAIPIAVVANVLRLTLIAIFTKMILTWPNYLLSEKLLADWPNNVTETWAHDVPGLMMMPIGLILLWIEWILISKLFVEEPAERAASIRRTQGLLPMANPARKGKQPSGHPAAAPREKPESGDCSIHENEK
jgi:exosortase/archaeosortase family protein